MGKIIEFDQSGVEFVDEEGKTLSEEELEENMKDMLDGLMDGLLKGE